MTLAVGHWLAERKFLGAFGLDALLYRGEVYLTEVNPRFQGSSLVTAYLDRALDRPDLYQEHLGAYLGLAPADQRSLREITAEAPAYSHILRFHTGTEPVQARPGAAADLPLRCRQIPAPEVKVLPGAIAVQAVVSGQVTANGMCLFEDVDRTLDAIYRELYGD